MYKLTSILAPALVFILLSCAGTKNAWTPVGNWDYTVSDTPNGDTFGTLIVSEEAGSYTGKLRSPEYGDAVISKFALDENNSLSGTFEMAGLELNISGTFEGDVFTGTIDAGYNGSFPIVANRQADQ
jgi:hypothetical protein